MKDVDRTDGRIHVPSYRYGCWGRPGARKCWLCRLRYPVALVRIAWRARRP